MIIGTLLAVMSRFQFSTKKPEVPPAPSRATMYSLLGRTLKLTVLQRKPALSSSLARGMNVPELVSYTASNVSKLLPTVLKVAMPSVGGRQENQTDFPPGTPACCGSTASAVAPAVVP